MTAAARGATLLVMSLTAIARPLGGLSADQVARLRRVAETCPVRRALEADFRFEETIVTAPVSQEETAA
jgi:hypothetical protein